MLDRLVLCACDRLRAGPGEVEIAVEASGLNFLAVLLALGVMPNDLPGRSNGAAVLGASECAGHIVGVGEGAAGLTVGQPGGRTSARAERLRPTSHTTDLAGAAAAFGAVMALEAAAMPVAYLTAWYALDRVVLVCGPGERVLIHAATGGVGLAAVQWGTARGGRGLCATDLAGSPPEKRAYLESLGVKYVSDSRSDRFVRRTCGHGRRAREWTWCSTRSPASLIEKSFHLLRSHGRFVELGKRDYYANSQLGLLAVFAQPCRSRWWT